MLFTNNYVTQGQAIGAQPFVFGAVQPARPPAAPAKRTLDQLLSEGTVISDFVARIDSLGPLDPATHTTRERVLSEVVKLARQIDARSEAGEAASYGRRVIFEDPDRWSIAAVMLRPGQSTECHDHGGWGCAATVQGIERNRCFVLDAAGTLTLSSEREYVPGTGYAFDAVEVHQPEGADPNKVTVALHFLVLSSHAQAHAEH